MICPKCGSQVPDQSKFCPVCGAQTQAPSPQPDPAAQPAPQPPAPSAAPTPFSAQPTGTQPPAPGSTPVPYTGQGELGMKWFKFLIYFSLFAGAVLNVFSAIGAFTGSQYEGSADYIYAMFGGLKVVDVLYGLVLLAFAAATIYVRQQLAGFKRDSPKLFLTLYVAEAAVSLLYVVVVIVIAISGVAAYVSAYISPFELALQVVPLGQVIAIVIGAVIYVVLNKIYFDKRAHLFTN